MIGGIAAHHGNIPAHFSFLPQQHAGFRIVTGKENQVGVGGLEFGQNGGVVALSGGKSVIEHHFCTGLFKHGLGFFCQTLGVRRVVVQQGHSLVATLFDGFGGRIALRVVARAGAEKELQAFFRQAHAGRAGANLHQFRFVQNALAGFGHGRAVGSDNSHNTGRSQLLRGQSGSARVACVVLDHKLNLAALDATLGIHIVNQQGDNVFHVQTFGRPFARKRTHEANLDVTSQRRNRHKQGKGQSPKPTTKCFHELPPSGMLIL